MTVVTIYEQECFGQVHFRVMRDDGRQLFGRLHTDFPTRDDALGAILGEFRREKLGPVKVFVCPIERQSLARSARRVELATQD